MNPRWPGARPPIPAFVSTGPAATVPLRPRAPGCLTGRIDHAHMARAACASHLARHPDLVRETYAQCDRAPFLWEQRTPAHPDPAKGSPPNCEKHHG